MSLSKVPTCPEKLCASLRALKSPWHILGGKCVSQGSANTQPLEEPPFPGISPANWAAVQGQPGGLRIWRKNIAWVVQRAGRYIDTVARLILMKI